jgi:hypothetical protein
MSKIMKNQIKSILSYGLILLAILAFGAITFIQVKTANAAGMDGYRPYNTPSLFEPEEEEENFAPSKNPAPVVNSISPKSANVGSGTKNVTITGNGFIPSSVARWNGSDRPTTFIDSSHLIIHLNSSDMNGSSGRYISVWNRSPGGGYSNAAFFAINGYAAPSGGNTSGNGSTSANNNSNSNASTVEGASDMNGDGRITSEDYSALASNAIFGSDSFMPTGLVQWLLFAIFILLVIIIVRKVFFVDKYHSTPLKHA